MKNVYRKHAFILKYSNENAFEIYFLLNKNINAFIPLLHCSILTGLRRLPKTGLLGSRLLYIHLNPSTGKYISPKLTTSKISRATTTHCHRTRTMQIQVMTAPAFFSTTGQLRANTH